MNTLATPQGRIYIANCQECGRIGYADTPSKAYLMQSYHYHTEHSEELVFEGDEECTGAIKIDTV